MYKIDCGCKQLSASQAKGKQCKLRIPNNGSKVQVGSSKQSGKAASLFFLLIVIVVSRGYVGVGAYLGNSVISRQIRHEACVMHRIYARNDLPSSCFISMEDGSELAFDTPSDEAVDELGCCWATFSVQPRPANGFGPPAPVKK